MVTGLPPVGTFTFMEHNMSQTLTTLPLQDGFRVPGEFETKAGCWLGWPERTDVWRNGAKPAQKVWVQIATAIAESEPVTICASAAQFANARAMLPKHIRVIEMTVNDSWFRDSGPAWLLNDKGVVRGVDFLAIKNHPAFALCPRL